MRGSLIGRVVVILAVSLGAGAVNATPATADPSVQFIGPFMIFNNSGSGCLVPGSLSLGAPIYAWNGCYTNEFPDMKWYLWSTTGGGYQIQNYLNDNRCIQAPNNSINTQLTLGPCSGDRARWMFTLPHESGGLVTLPNAVSGLCATGEDTPAWSEKVVQWYCMTQFTDLWWLFLPAF